MALGLLAHLPELIVPAIRPLFLRRAFPIACRMSRQGQKTPTWEILVTNSGGVLLLQRRSRGKSADHCQHNNVDNGLLT
jgi:hypothetical protein